MNTLDQQLFKATNHEDWAFIFASLDVAAIARLFDCCKLTIIRKRGELVRKGVLSV